MQARIELIKLRLLLLIAQFLWLGLTGHRRDTTGEITDPTPTEQMYTMTLSGLRKEIDNFAARIEA